MTIMARHRENETIVEISEDEEWLFDFLYSVFREARRTIIPKIRGRVKMSFYIDVVEGKETTRRVFFHLLRKEEGSDVPQ